MNPEITSAQDFKKKASERKKPQVLELPSGAKVMAVRPEFTKLIKEGIISSNLIGSAMEASIDKTKAEDAAKKIDLAEGIEFVEKVVIATVVEPKIVSGEPNEDEISINDLEETDMNFIFEWAGVDQGGTPLESFRKE